MMPTPSSGPISLNDLQTEFGGSNPISLSEYYKADVDVPAFPAEIGLSDLRGKFRHATRNQSVVAFNAGFSTDEAQANRGYLFDVLGFIGNESILGTFQFYPESLNAVTYENALNTTQNTVIVAYASGVAGTKIPSLNIFGTSVPSTSFAVNKQTGSYGVVSYVMPDKFPSTTIKRLRNLTNDIVWDSNLVSDGGSWGGIYACMMLPNKWSVTNILNTNAAVGAEATVTMDPNDFLIVCFNWPGGDWNDGYYGNGINSSVPPPNYKLLDGATGLTAGGVRAPSGKTVTAVNVGGAVGWVLQVSSGHGFVVGDSIKFTSTGSLPPPLNNASDEVFYVHTVVNANQFKVSLSSANPDLHNPITITSNGTGIHTVYDYTLGESLAPVISVAGKWYQSGGVLIYRNAAAVTKTYRIPTRMDWQTQNPKYGLEIGRMAQLVTFSGNGYKNSTNS
jgi:hypothetical protein